MHDYKLCNFSLVRRMPSSLTIGHEEVCGFCKGAISCQGGGTDPHAVVSRLHEWKLCATCFQVGRPWHTSCVNLEGKNDSAWEITRNNDNNYVLKLGSKNYSKSCIEISKLFSLIYFFYSFTSFYFPKTVELQCMTMAQSTMFWTEQSFEVKFWPLINVLKQYTEYFRVDSMYFYCSYKVGQTICSPSALKCHDVISCILSH